MSWVEKRNNRGGGGGGEGGRDDYSRLESSKNEVINLMKNIDLTETGEHYKTKIYYHR